MNRWSLFSLLYRVELRAVSLSWIELHLQQLSILFVHLRGSPSLLSCASVLEWFTCAAWPLTWGVTARLLRGFSELPVGSFSGLSPCPPSFHKDSLSSCCVLGAQGGVKLFSEMGVSPHGKATRPVQSMADGKHVSGK